MYGQPVVYKEVHSIGTQTDDNGCNNGCTSMYINTDRHSVTDISETFPRQLQQTHLHSKSRPQPKQQIQRQMETLHQLQFHQEPHSQQQLQQQREPQIEPSLEPQHVIDIQPRRPHLSVLVESKDDAKSGCDAENEWNDDNEQELVQDMEEVTTMLAVLENKFISSQTLEYNKQNDLRVAAAVVQNTTQQDCSPDYLQCPHDGCELQFVDEQPLIVHFRSHRENQGILCRKTFQSISHRIGIHELGKEKPFECPTCKKRFCRRHSLKRHIKIHYTEKPYQCTNCLRKFSDQSNLQRHIKLRTKRCKAVS